MRHTYNKKLLNGLNYAASPIAIQQSQPYINFLAQKGTEWF